MPDKLPPDESISPGELYGELSNKGLGRLGQRKPYPIEKAFPEPNVSRWEKYRSQVASSLNAQLFTMVHSAILGDPEALSTKIGLAVGGDLFGVIPTVLKRGIGTDKPHEEGDFKYIKAADIVDINHVKLVEGFLGNRSEFSPAEAEDISQALTIISTSALYKLFKWECKTAWEKVYELECRELKLPFGGRQRLETTGQMFEESAKLLDADFTKMPNWKACFPARVALRDLCKQMAIKSSY